MCKLFNLIYLLPLKSLRRWLIKYHMTKCDQCKLSENLDQRILNIMHNSFDWINYEKNHWPASVIEESPWNKQGIEANIKTFFLAKWRLIVAVLSLVCFIGLNAVYFYLPKQEPASDNRILPELKILYAKIKGEEAIPFLYISEGKTFILFLSRKSEREK